jgi:hypothetical protein
MKRPPHSSIRVSLQMGMIAFFILAATSPAGGVWSFPVDLCPIALAHVLSG